MTPSMLPEIDRRTLEFWLTEFDQTWADGRLAEFVARLPAQATPLRRVALIELIKLDLQHQRARGRQPQLAAYLRVYPELGTPPAPPPELTAATHAPRQQPSTAPAPPTKPPSTDRAPTAGPSHVP